MTIDTKIAPEDLAKLARVAPSFAPPPSADQGTAENAVEANERLAAGLDRLRGEAVQRAKMANTRLRRRAIEAATLSLGVGVLLGWLVSPKHGRGSFATRWKRNSRRSS